ncbi:MAG TPA: NUDIX hydrolase, partial [Micromonosporaceae bacterium]
LEETDQAGTVTELLTVSHRHQRGLRGPEGVPLDWHGVRALFRVRVDRPTPARVVEGRGGSTAAAAWFSPAEALALPLTEFAWDAITTYVSR